MDTLLDEACHRISEAKAVIASAPQLPPGLSEKIAELEALIRRVIEEQRGDIGTNASQSHTPKTTEDPQLEVQRLRAELAVNAAYRYAAERGALAVTSLQQQVVALGGSNADQPVSSTPGAHSSDVDRWRSEVESTRTQNTLLQQQLDRVHAEMRTQREHALATERSERQLKEEVDKLTAGQTHLLQQLATARKQMQEGMPSPAAERDLATVRSELTVLRSKALDLEGKLTAKEVAIAALEGKLRAAEAREVDVSAVEVDMEEKAMILSQLQAENKRLQEVLRTSQRQRTLARGGDGLMSQMTSPASVARSTAPKAKIGPVRVGH